MYGINENTRILFLKAINDMDKQLKYYAKKKDSNSDYIERKNRQIQDLFNFYNEVENTMHNFKFTGDVFNITNTPDFEELRRLRSENRTLRARLNENQRPRHVWNIKDREAFRADHELKQQLTFNY